MASVSTEVKVKGTAAFQRDFSSASKAVKAASSELKYFSNELTRTGASEDALKNKMNALNTAMESETNAVNMLQERIKFLNETTGGQAVNEINKWTAELYKHKDAQSQLQSEIDSTEKEIQDLASGADKATTEVDELGDKAEEAGSQIGSSFATDVAKATVFFEKLANAAIWVGKQLWDIGKSAVEYNMQIETYSRSIQAFFETSGQSSEEAAKNTQELVKNQKALSSQIGVGADVLIEANRSLISVGIGGEQAQTSVEALAKACVAVGASDADMQRMVQNLAEIQGKTKADTMDIRQFAKIGIDLWSLMSETTGKTITQLQDMDITYEMISDALVHATSEGGKFYEASQVGATTLQGQINTLQSNIREGLGTAFQPFNDMLSNEVIPNLLEISENIDWDALGEMMADAAKVASDAFGTLVETLGYLAEAYVTVKDAIDDWGNVGERVVNDISQNYLGTAGAYKRAYDEQNRFTEGTSTGLKKIDDAASEVNKVIAGMPVAWIEAVPLAQGVGEDIADAVSTPIKDLETQAPIWMEHFGTELSDSLAAQAPKFGAAASELAKAAQDYLGFSVPDKGPLHEYQEWMPHMMEGLSKGIYDNLWRVQEASLDVASTLANTRQIANYYGGINISVNAQNGTNANAIANEVMYKIQQATNSRRAVWS